TIVLSDGPTVTGSTGDLTMTRAEFEALQVRPPVHSHENFTVGMSVTSYEVDDSGNPLSGVPGATSSIDVNVRVQAVTDDAQLVFDTTATGGIDNVDAVTYGGTGGNTEARVTIKEDTAF